MSFFIPPQHSQPDHRRCSHQCRPSQIRLPSEVHRKQATLCHQFRENRRKLTPFDNITREEKIEKGEQAVSEILEGLIKKEEYLQLTKEYNRKTTPEAIFASNCDKLEMLLQMKIYEELGYSDINKKENKSLLENNWVKELINNGSSSIADLFFDFHTPSFDEDIVFKNISNYAKINSITKKQFNI